MRYELEDSELQLYDGVDVDNGEPCGEFHTVDAIKTNEEGNVVLEMDNDDEWLFADLHPTEMENVIVYLLDELGELLEQQKTN